MLPFFGVATPFHISTIKVMYIVHFVSYVTNIKKIFALVTNEKTAILVLKTADDRQQRCERW